MEKVVVCWDALQFFLYSRGICKDTILTGNKCFDVTIWDHYDLDVIASKDWFQKYSPPNGNLLKNSLVFWKGRQFGKVEDFGDKILDKLVDVSTHSLYYLIDQAKAEKQCFDCLGFVKQKNSDVIQFLPVKVKYSASTKFQFSAVTHKPYKNFSDNAPFPFMIFIVAGDMTISKASTINNSLFSG